MARAPRQSLQTYRDFPCPSLQEIEERGIKVPPTSVEKVVGDLPAAPGELLRNRSLYARLGQAARRRVPDYFNWDKKGEFVNRYSPQLVVTSYNAREAITARAKPPIRLGLLLIALSAGTLFVLSSVPASMNSWDVIRLGAVVLSLVLALYLALASTAASNAPTRIGFRCALVIWMFLLLSEELFRRTEGDLQSALNEQFSVGAYGEISLWILSFLALLVLSVRSPKYLHSMISTRYKWLLRFGALCLLSAVYSPQPSFSIAWAFKLCLVILLLGICSVLIRDERHIIAFLRATLWACSVYVVAEVYRALTDPSVAFHHGRLGVSPTSLSVVAGVGLILSLTLCSLAASAWLLLFAITASMAMILSGGKAGIVGGLLSATLFYLIKKKTGSAVALLSGLVGLAVALYIGTPLKSYFDTYAESGQVNTLTDRTDYWRAGLTAIRQSPVLGHGYMASRFISAGAGFEAAYYTRDPGGLGHLHNAFLDVLYNDGLIGLGLVLVVHTIVIRNLLRVIRCPGAPRGLYDIAAGSLAVYVNLLINALFNSTIGGRPSTLFMLFLALFVLSESVRTILAQTMAESQRALESSSP